MKNIVKVNISITSSHISILVTENSSSEIQNDNTIHRVYNSNSYHFLIPHEILESKNADRIKNFIDNSVWKKSCSVMTSINGDPMLIRETRESSKTIFEQVMNFVNSDEYKTNRVLES